MKRRERARDGAQRRQGRRRRAPAAPGSGLTAGLAAGLAAMCWLPALAHADSDYDALIRRARAGDYAPALAMLRERVARAPSDQRAAWDCIVIASWAGRPEEVLETYGSLRDTRALPPEVLAAVAGALRDQRRWDEALARYREGRQRFPTHAVFALGEVKVLADSGQAAEAVALGQALVQREPAAVDSRLALAYAQARAGEPYAALFEADQAYLRAPPPPPVVREDVGARPRPGGALFWRRGAAPGTARGGAARRGRAS